MSQAPPPPPPLPPVAPIPVAPVPVSSIPAAPFDPPAAQVAWPAFPPAARVSRPGIVSAVGTASIVVASLCVIANIYTAISLLFFSVAAPAVGARGPGGGRFGPGGGPVVAPVQAVPPAPVVTGTAVVVDAGGMDAGARRTTAQTLDELEFLSAGRLAQLDVLLAKCGLDAFPLRDAPVTRESVGKLVQSHGTTPSADPSQSGPHFFRTPEGRIELYDDRAVFSPTRGGENVRTSTLTTTNPGLTPPQVQAVVQQAQAASGGALNAAQVAALQTLVGAEGQQFVSPLTVQTAVRSAALSGADGSVVVQFPNGFATFGPQGQTTSAAGPNATAPMSGRPRINGAAMALAVFATLATSGLAVYLFVIGILTLRQSPRGRKWHLAYAGFKIPVTILGAAAAWWLTASFTEASLAAMTPGAAEAGTMSSSIGTQQLYFGLIGLIYPVTLLIVLQARSVKDYYRSLE